MGDKAPIAAAAGERPAHVTPTDWAGYQKQRQQLRESLNVREKLRNQLAQVEANIASQENTYLESTPSGNIITGFDNYTKGVSSAAAHRRRTGQMDQNRVFSRSSISYNANNAESIEAGTSSASTPAAATPISTSFARDRAGGTTSEAPTPTSATEPKGKNSKNNKKKKAPTAAAAAAAAAAATAASTAESENDTPKENKKIRTSFGARK